MAVGVDADIPGNAQRLLGNLARSKLRVLHQRPRRRRRVRLEQRRGNGQRARDVVEAARRVVGRQQRRDVDLEAEEIANRVRVLRPIEAMEDDGARGDKRLAAPVRRRRQRSKPGAALAPTPWASSIGISCFRRGVR